MAKKQPTKKTEPANEARPKAQDKSEGVVPATVAPPKVVMAIKDGKREGFAVSEVTQSVVQVGTMKPHGYKVLKPKSSNAMTTSVVGSAKGPIVHGVSGKMEASPSGQSTPNSN